MRSKIVLSIVSSWLLICGCQSDGGTAKAESFLKYQGSTPTPESTWLAVGLTEWLLAPVGLPESSSVNVLISGRTDAPLKRLPESDGFSRIGSGPWVNVVSFNRQSGTSRLVLDRRAIVWQVVLSVLESDAVLLLIAEADTNKDGRLNDLDATAVYHLNLKDNALSRLTPERTTVVSAIPDPVFDGVRRAVNDGKLETAGDGFLANGELPPPPVNGLLVTVRTDVNNDGKFESSEPTQVIRIDPSLKTKPQSVMDASQWQKALEIWKNG